MKKRSCRRTPEENREHDQAVKIRKMTDEQIVEYISRIKEDAYSAGYAQAAGCDKVEEFIDYLQENRPQGIGAMTLNRIANIAKENGFLR